jgi:hypothetical protein
MGETGIMGQSAKRLKRTVFESLVDKIQHAIDGPPVEYTPQSKAEMVKRRRKRDAQKEKS